MRATIYTRISKDREGAGLGVTAQENDCRDLAARHGHSIVSVHTDNDLSAYSGKPRPGYLALLDDIRSGGVDVVLAWHTDRLHRSPAELEHYATTCAEHGVTTLTVKAGPLDLSTPSGLLVARMLGNVSRYEVDHMIERQQRAKLRSAQAGRWKGGRRPFGYEADGVTLRESEATLLRDATASVLAGETLGSITRRWNESGSTTTTGGRWDATGVRRTLLRPRNAGLMEHQRQVLGKAEWPAVVDEDSWRAVVHLLTDPTRRTTTGPERRWLGSGLYRCAICQETVVASSTGKRRGYRCRPGHITRQQEVVDAEVAAHVVARLRLPDARDLLLSTTGAEADEGAVAREVLNLRGRLDELAAMYAAGTIDGPQLKAGTEPLRASLAEAEARLSSLTAGTAVDGIADAPDPGQAWLDAPLGQQRAVVDALMTVTLHPAPKGRPPGWRPGQPYFHPESVKIRWRTDDE